MYESDPWDALEQAVSTALFGDHPYARAGARHARGPARHRRRGAAPLSTATSTAPTAPRWWSPGRWARTTSTPSRPRSAPSRPAPRRDRRCRRGSRRRSWCASSAATARCRGCCWRCRRRRPTTPTIRCCACWSPRSPTGAPAGCATSWSRSASSACSSTPTPRRRCGPGTFTVEAELHEGAEPREVEERVLAHLRALAEAPLRRGGAGAGAGGAARRLGVRQRAGAPAGAHAGLRRWRCSTRRTPSASLGAGPGGHAPRSCRRRPKRWLGSRARRSSAGRCRRRGGGVGEPGSTGAGGDRCVPRPCESRAGSPTAPPRLDLRVRRVPGVPVVAVRVWLRGGARAEPRPGISWATGRLLTEGTATRDWRALATAAEDRGATLHGFGGYEAHGLAVDALAADWELALAWMAELLLASASPPTASPGCGARARPSSRATGTSPRCAPSWAFLDQLYAPNPRAPAGAGRPREPRRARSPRAAAPSTPRSLARGVIVAVAGEIAEEAVARASASCFGAARSAASATLGGPAAAGRRAASRAARLPSGAVDQAHLYLGHLTVPRLHPDHAALEVLGVVLGAGAGLTGRIPERLREREGLAYTAQASVVGGASSEPGRLVVYVATSPRTWRKPRASAREELAAAARRRHQRRRVRGGAHLPARPRALPPRDRSPVGRPARRGRLLGPAARRRRMVRSGARGSTARGRSGGAAARAAGGAQGDSRFAGEVSAAAG